MPTDMKKLIAETFLEMAKQSGIDKITVKALIAECGISRQTFYYHFQDMMDVIEWLIQRAVDRMVARSLEAGTRRDALNILISSTMEERVLIRKMLNSQKREVIEKLFVSATRAYLQEVLRNGKDDSPLNYSDMEVALDFCSFGLCGILFQYCIEEKTDVDDLVGKLCRLIPEGVRDGA